MRDRILIRDLLEQKASSSTFQGSKSKEPGT